MQKKLLLMVAVCSSLFSCKDRTPSDADSKDVTGSSQRSFDSNEIRKLRSIQTGGGGEACIANFGVEVFVFKAANSCKDVKANAENKMLKLVKLANDQYYFDRNSETPLGKDDMLCVGEFDVYCSINFDGDHPKISLKNLPTPDVIVVPVKSVFP